MFNSKFLRTALTAALLFVWSGPATTQVPMTGAGVGSPDDLSTTPISTACTASSGTTITFTAQGVGPANANRTSVVSINWSDSTAAGTAELTAVTIGGISMVRGVRASGDNQNSNAEIWYIANPTGTSANIVATFSTAVDGVTIGVYSLIGYLTSPTASTAGTTSVSQAHTNKQVALAAASRTTNVSTSLSNMTNDYSAACGATLWGVHASQRLNGNGTLSSTISPTSSNPKIALAVWVGTTAGTCNEATAFLARTTSPDATHISAYTNFICGLVADNVWTKFDALYVLAAQSTTNALLSLVSSTFNATSNGSPTFTADRGYTGTNLSATVYLSTNFNPSTASSPKFTQNSAHVSGWSVTDAGALGTGFIGYSITTNEAAIVPKYTDNNAYFRTNSSGSAGQAVATSQGFYIGNRSSSTAVQGYKDGSQIMTHTSSDNSVAIQNANMAILAININTVPQGSGHQIAFASIGSSLSSDDALAFYTRARTYATAVGMP